MTTRTGTWQQNCQSLSKLLFNLSIRDGSGHDYELDEGFAQWRAYCLKLKANRQKMFLIGNGASSSMASHFATDIIKNSGIRTLTFTDASLLTAVSNDISFEEVFAEPIKWQAKEGDMLVAISSSGNSPNIVKALAQAQEQKLITVTLSAMSEKNIIRSLGDLNFYIGAETYGHAESGHAVILHHWMDLLEESARG